MRHLQSDYEKRLKEVETQKEQLLDEMESRETTLINKVYNNYLICNIWSMVIKFLWVANAYDYL